METQIIGIDIAKRVFQRHGAGADGQVMFRKTQSRGQLLAFLTKRPTCIVAMEACATAHHWGREITALGHDVRLIPPVYVKPFVKRQKNDANDAEAIAEAASRPTMRFVPVKTVDRQAHATLFRGRGLLVAQRTQLLNALRGHLAEYGLITAEGARRTLELARGVVTERGGRAPEAVVALGELMLVQIEGLTAAIGDLEKRLKAEARLSARTRQLQTMPGVGPMTAIALNAFAPPPEAFASGRDFAAWVGLVPRQHSTGGKTRLGRTSKMGAEGHSKTAHRRRHCRGQMGGAPRVAAGHLAWQDARAETEDAGRDRARQQDGARALGDDDPRRAVPTSCGGLSGTPRTKTGERSAKT